MKKYGWIILIIIGIVIGFLIGGELGWGILGLFGIGGGATALNKAKKRVNEAGEDIEKKSFDDADSAANYVDDILSDNSTGTGEHKKD
jgi:hypothetical protein